jgi:hypothetical protein
MGKLQELKQNWANYQPSKTALAWSCVACVAGTIAVGFIWGGWVTGGSAKAMAATAAESARSEVVAAFCVDRFRAGEDVAAQLETLKGLQSWKRREFIVEGGWLAMPGKGSTTQAATLCADALLAEV